MRTFLKTTFIICYCIFQFNVSAQIGIPVNKEKSQVEEAILEERLSKSDSLKFLKSLLEKLKNTDLEKLNTDNKLDSTTIQVGSFTINLRLLNDYKFLDTIYKIGYKEFLGKKYKDNFRKKLLQRDFERTLSALSSAQLLSRHFDIEEGKVTNKIDFTPKNELNLKEAELQNQDSDLKKKEEYFEKILNFTAKYYNRTRNYRWLYWPLFDWPKQMNKSSLTELFFTNQFSEEKFSALSNSLLSIDFKNKASLYTDILTSYLGPGRLSLSTLVSNNQPLMNDSDTLKIQKEDAIQRLIGGGGNLGLAYQIPLLSVNIGRNISWGSLMQPRIAMDIPALNATLDTTTIQYEFANQGFVNIYTSSTAISFFGGYKIAYIFGNQKYKNLIDEDDFWYRQISFGITINETFRIVYNDFGGDKFARENFPKSSLSVILVAK